MRIPCWTSHRNWHSEDLCGMEKSALEPRQHHVFLSLWNRQASEGRDIPVFTQRDLAQALAKKKKKRYPICMSLLDYPRHPISGWEYEVWSPELLPYPPFPQTLDCSQKLHWKHIHIKDSTRAKTTLPSPKGCWFTFCERSKRILKMLLLFSLLPEWWDFKTEQCLCFKDLVGSEKSRNNSQ